MKEVTEAIMMGAAEIERLRRENEKLKAELELYKGALHKENEATQRANYLEDKITEARKWIEEYKTEWTDGDEIKADMDILLQIL